jgi:hypothetical protein
MRSKALVILLAILLVPVFAGAQPAAPPPSKSALVTYYAGNPFGACAGFQRLWWNTTSDVLWFCEGGAWISVLGAAPSPGFPITRVVGPNTVTLDASVGADSLSLYNNDATTGAGFNAGVGTLGYSAFAYNTFFNANISTTLSESSASQTALVEQAAYRTKLNLLINGESQDHPHAILRTEDGTTFAQFEIQTLSLAPSMTATLTDASNTQTFTMQAARHELIHNEGSLQGKLVVEAGDGSQGLYSTDGSNYARVTTDTDPPRANLAAGDGSLASAVDVKAYGPADVTTGTQPTCDSGSRARRWFVEGGTGVADTYEVCMKSSLDTYAWVVLAVNP